MKIVLKESVIVKPMEETPCGSLWLSSLDLLQPDVPYHSRAVFFYRPNGTANFFDAAVLKAAFSRALVEFYPYLGRLRKDGNGRLEINCNGEGALFVEAECDGTVDELGGFSPRPDISLLPTVDYSKGISTFPLSLIQLTRFKCGGISLGIATEHHVADAISFFEFMHTWCDIARGRTAAAAVPPFLDRRVLAARNPPRPRFPHIEHQPFPSLKTPLHDSDTTFKTFSLTRDQINALKQICNNNYTSYEAIAGHVWRCVCTARRLPRDQETKLQFPVNGRQRLSPPLPPGYFGNVNFYTAAIALCGELESNPLSFAVGKVQEAIARMDDEYLRSAIDYWELELRRKDAAAAVPLVANKVKCPNFGITSWGRLPFYDSDFGWGKPVFVGPGVAANEGKSFLFADPENEGSMLLAITLHKPHMTRFEKLIYDNINCCIISKI